MFIGAFISAFRAKGLAVRWGLAAGCALLEAAGGSLDNLVMNIPVFAYYWATVAAAKQGLPFSG